MSRNRSEICLEIGKIVKRSGASPKACNKVNDLLVEIAQAKNEVYLQGRADQKHEDLDAQVILTKHEIEVITNSVLDKLLVMANEKSQYENINGDVETIILYDTLHHIVKQLKKSGTTIEPVISNKQPTPDSIKKCAAYEDGCEEWAGCPCTNYKPTK